MNIKRAWAALWREPEPVEVEKVVEKVVEKFVPVGDKVVDLYMANDKAVSAYRHYGIGAYCPPKPAPWHGSVYRSCAEAFAACGTQAEVVTFKGFVCGDDAYAIDKPYKLKLAPKPRVAKGRAK